MTVTECVVSTLLNFVFDKVVSCIGSSWGVNEDLKKLRRTLLTIQAVLEDAEARQVKEKSLKVWLRNLKDVAYDIDDLSDRVVHEDREIESRKKKKARHYLNPLTYFNPPISRNDLARSIKEIRERLDEIAKERSQFHLQERVGFKEEIGVVREETGSFVNESEVYGRQKDKEKIVEFLINNSSPGGDDLGVLAIVGMGGLGKTTVAQVAYNDEKVCKYFAARMWVCVSEDFDIKRIGRSIIESFGKNEHNLQYMDSIQNALIDKLRNKRFLLVLDDVWDEDQEKWGNLKSLLRSGAKGSKVIVTTRIANVAHIMATVPLYQLSILSEDYCWKLFEGRAFGSGGASKTPNLVAIGKEIVKKCGGVPLAAKALGSLMRFKKRGSEWRTVRDSELWELTDDENEILPALNLSYSHLPLRLKQCFAYCSVFPKDYVIEKETLVQLWIAEGFIRSSNENTYLEDVGFQYVDELLSRSLLQIAWKYGDGEITHVKMHDLVHDLARSVAGEECSIVDASTGKGFYQSSRYSSFLYSEDDISAILEPLNQANKLRTFHLINPPWATWTDEEQITTEKEEQITNLLYVIFSKLKLLRTLRLPKCPIKSLPDSVSNLGHLRYLDLNDACFRALPSCVGDLHNLLTLDLGGCKGLLSLPDSIGRLTNLRKLNLEWCSSLKALPESIGDLHNLVTLDLGYCFGLLSLPDSIGRLTSLQKLNLEGCSSLKALPESIGDLHNLLTLDLGYCFGLLSLPDSIGRLTSLQKLNLEGCSSLKALPESIGDLHNLLTLVLSGCFGLLSLPDSIGRLTSLQKLNLFECSSLKALLESIGDLHNLVTLYLGYCFGLLSLPDSIGRLTSLQQLNLEGWSSLKALLESIGDLHNLVTLYLGYCVGLMSLPDSIGRLTSLQELNLEECSSLKALPESIGDLHNLLTLDLRGCFGLLSSPDSIGPLTGLQELNRYAGKSLQDLLQSLGSL